MHTNTICNNASITKYTNVTHQKKNEKAFSSPGYGKRRQLPIFSWFACVKNLHMHANVILIVVSLGFFSPVSPIHLCPIPLSPPPPDLQAVFGGGGGPRADGAGGGMSQGQPAEDQTGCLQEGATQTHKHTHTQVLEEQLGVWVHTENRQRRWSYLGLGWCTFFKNRLDIKGDILC